MNWDMLLTTSRRAGVMLCKTWLFITIGAAFLTGAGSATTALHTTELGLGPARTRGTKALHQAP